jgi:uncharacterized protein
MRQQRVSRAAILLRVGGAIILLCAVWFWPVGTIPVRPSFDCATAALPTEKTICADPQLAAVDTEVAQYYQDNLLTASNFSDTAKIATLKHDQQQFVEQRDRCGAASWCIQRSYASWDQQLEDVGGAPRRITSARNAFPQPRTYVGALLLHRRTHR